MTDTPLVLRTYIEGLETHDVAKIAATVAKHLAFVLADRKLDKSQFLAMLRALYAAFPDWRYEHSPPELRQEFIAIKWRQGGTHTGTFKMAGLDPIEATGRAVNIPEQYFFCRVRGGRIVEIRPDPVRGGCAVGNPGTNRIDMTTPPL